MPEIYQKRAIFGIFGQRHRAYFLPHLAYLFRPEYSPLRHQELISSPFPPIFGALQNWGTPKFGVYLMQPLGDKFNTYGLTV